MNQFSVTRLAPAVLLVMGLAVPAGAQQPPAVPPAPVPPQPQVVLYQNTATDANQVRQQLEELLRQYPPSVRQVLQVDPTLMNRPDYIAPYPLLVGFLQQHPEIARNPSFFFGEAYFEREQTDRQRAFNVMRDIIGGFAFLIGFVVAISLIYSLLRAAIEHRRWRRQIQIQTDVHTKLFDRLTSNQDLLAYMESPAGRRFLESAPIAAAMPQATMAPITRMLWSVQIGIVVAAVGGGFWMARGAVDDVDVSRVMTVMGTLAVAVGVGFIISAMVSWLLSMRLGLLSGVKSEA